MIKSDLAQKAHELKNKLGVFVMTELCEGNMHVKMNADMVKILFVSTIEFFASTIDAISIITGEDRKDLWEDAKEAIENCDIITQEFIQ
jgi:hypothetical protein